MRLSTQNWLTLITSQSLSPLDRSSTLTRYQLIEPGRGLRLSGPAGLKGRGMPDSTVCLKRQLPAGRFPGCPAATGGGAAYRARPAQRAGTCISQRNTFACSMSSLNPFPHAMMQFGHFALHPAPAVTAPGLNQAQRIRYIVKSCAVWQMRQIPSSGIQCFGGDIVKGSHLCVQCGWKES